MKTTCLYLWNKYPEKYYPKLDNKKKDPQMTKNNPTIKKKKEQKNLDID